MRSASLHSPKLLPETLPPILPAAQVRHVTAGPEPLDWRTRPGRTDRLQLHKEPEQTRERVRFPFLPTSHRTSDRRKRVWCPGRHEVREPEAAGLVLKVSAAYGNEHRKVTIVVFCWFLLKNAEKRKVTKQCA